MQKSWKFVSGSKTPVMSFCTGFVAFSVPVAGYTVNLEKWRNFVVHSSFAEDQKNLRSDFIKSYIATIKEHDERIDDQQLSLNLKRTYSNGRGLLEHE